MKKVQLGKTGMMVSNLSLGTIKFGTLVEEKQCEKLMDFYVKNGGNFIDTSNAYSYWVNNSNGGESEEVIGNWMEKRGNRKDLIIATKMGALPNDRGPKSSTNLQGTSGEIIIREVNRSLKRLKTDYIDILYLHIDDRECDLREAMKTLSQLKSDGKIRAYGASNFKTWRLEQARQICREENIDFFAAIQQKYSYLAPVSDYDMKKLQYFNDELKDYLNSYGDMTLVAYSVLLKGQYLQDEILESAYDTKENRDRLEELKGKTDNPNGYVLNWVTEQNGGSIALMTASSIKHLKANMGL